MGILGDLVLIIVSGAVAGVIAQQVRQPLIVGYILAGVIIGPNTGFVQVSDHQSIEFLAELGVALLLFALGLEVSFRDLKSVRKVALIGTPIQITLTICFGVLTGYAFGWPMARGIWFGGLIALSSTMVVLKTLEARELTGTMSSRVMIGMLIVQDLAIVPLVILLPQLAGPETDLILLAKALLQAAGVLAAIYIAGTRLVPVLMHYIAAQKSRELFLLVTIALAFGIGWLTHFAGLSFAFGAFVAGIVLSESDYGHQALSEILSLRDLFGLVFFTSIGMLMDPRLVVEHWAELATMVALVFAGKGTIFALVTRSFGYRRVIPLAVGIGLAQIGEFSFLLGRTGIASGTMDRELFGLMISTAVVTMLLTPYLALAVTPAYRLQRWLFKVDDPPFEVPPEADAGGHAVIAGGGRVGHLVSAVLKAYAAPFVVIEYDQGRVDHGKTSNMPILYGDATSKTVLEAAGVASARLVVVTPPVIGVAREIVRKVRELNPNVHLVVRSSTTGEIQELAKLGANDVIQPEFEASLEIIRNSLLHLDVSPLEVQRFIESTHQNMYQPIMQEHGNEFDPARARQLARYVDLRWTEVHPDAEIIGKSIGELGLRSKFGVSVVALIRGNQTLYNIGPDQEIEAGDWLGCLGDSSGLAAMRNLAGG